MRTWRRWALVAGLAAASFARLATTAAPEPAPAPCLFVNDQDPNALPVVALRIDPETGRLFDAPVLGEGSPRTGRGAGAADVGPARPFGSRPLAAWSDAAGRHVVVAGATTAKIHHFSVGPECALRLVETVDTGVCIAGGDVRRIDNLAAAAGRGPTTVYAASGNCAEVQAFRVDDGGFAELRGSPFRTLSGGPVTSGVVHRSPTVAVPDTWVASSAGAGAIETQRVTRDGALVPVASLTVGVQGAVPAGVDVGVTGLTDGATVVLGTASSSGSDVVVYRLDDATGRLTELDTFAIARGGDAGAEVPQLPLAVSAGGTPVSIWASLALSDLLSCVVIEEIGVDPTVFEELELPCPTSMDVAEVGGKTVLYILIFDPDATVQAYEVLPDGSLAFLTSMPVAMQKGQGIEVLP